MKILQQLIQIVLLQRRPQDLDFDQNAAAFYVVLAIGMSYITSAQSGAFTHPLAISAVQNLAQAVFLFVFLQIAGKGTRFVQTCTAWFGVTTLLTLIVWLLAQVPAMSLLVLILMGWSFCLTVIILRDSFDAGLFRAVLLTVGIGMLSVILTMLVVPNYAEEAQAVLGQTATVTSQAQ